MTDYQAPAPESAAVKQWLKDICEATEFDAEARKAYAMCRRYARGDSSFTVHVPLLASYIDILVAFVYAQDPDVDVLPADRVTGERMSRLANQPAVQNQRDMSRTLEVVIARTLRDARLKDRARRMVRAILTVGIGWLKVTWQERMGQDPVILGQLRDLQDNLSRIEAQTAEIESGEVTDPDLAAEKLRLEIAGLQAKVEVMVARGAYIDHVPAEDIIIPACVASLTDYLSSPWMAHATYMPRERAKAEFPKVADKITSATGYSIAKPESQEQRKTPVMREFSATDATQYRKSDGDAENVCVYEIWDAQSNQVITIIDGMDCYAKEPYSPPATTRFYPFFGTSFTEVDGERHPASLVARSIPLMDEINRTLSAWATHRRRIKPGTIFNKKVLSPEDAKALQDSTEQEYVGVTPVDAAGGGDYDMRKLLVAKQYAPVDPMLYDTSPARAQLEAIWGIQEALSGTIQTAKTATEAEIQQAGTTARTGAMRDYVEGLLQEVAQYTAEIVLGKLDLEDAREIAGPEAFWPTEPWTVEQLRMLVSVDIRAGSTGKPNTTASREAWATTMPLIQGAIGQIAQLRMSPKTQVADALEELVVETLDRTGDRIDVTRFMPQEGQPVVDPNAVSAGAEPAPMPM